MTDTPTDTDLDALMVELAAAVSPHITGDKYTRLRVIAARRFLNAITALRAENARYRASLEWIERRGSSQSYADMPRRLSEVMAHIARQALGDHHDAQG